MNEDDVAEGSCLGFMNDSESKRILASISGSRSSSFGEPGTKVVGSEVRRSSEEAVGQRSLRVHLRGGRPDQLLSQSLETIPLERDCAVNRAPVAKLLHLHLVFSFCLFPDAF